MLHKLILLILIIPWIIMKFSTILPEIMILFVSGGSPSRRSSSSSLRHSRSWSKVISLAITIPSGLLGTGEANKKR